ncbi:MAG: Na+/H+ antiporter NhaA [Moraxellaceae bacterium]|nr:MAG: Na+/H+ antiporter NhaA [Moraxellaceae bacterium]
MLAWWSRFSRSDAFGGIVLMAATALALLAANSPLAGLYNQFLSLKLVVAVGDFSIAKPLLLWINDGLMTLFFLMVGLELKREILVGELSQPSKIAFPAAAAVGGMIVPALIYTAFNYHDSIAINGWAIPTATDIAFALGVLSLLGSRVPAGLKLFLVTLAIFDDLGAIVIIALFYTDNLSVTAIICAAFGLGLLAFMNWRGGVNRTAYLLIGLFVWVSLLKSGVHATLAGVAIALLIPYSGVDDSGRRQTPVEDLEHDLHSVVNQGVLPLFAFANAGLSFAGLSLSALFAGVPLGICLGLLIGKPLGVMLFAWLAVKLGIGRLPDDVNWSQIFGAAIMCGVGFTMSLFIGSLAFENVPIGEPMNERLGILIGSVLSAVFGYIWLARVAKPKH